MKTKLTILGSLATLGAVASLNAQSAVTPAVGYHSENLVQGFNLLAINVGNPVSAAGAFDGPGAVDADVDFTVLLTGGPYTVQNITTGDVAKVTSFTADTLTTDPALTTALDDQYEVREDQSISDIFGAANEAGLLPGTGSTADRIWVPKGDGTFDLIYFNNVNQPFPQLTPGWRADGGGNVDQSGLIIPFTSAVFIERRDPADLPLTFVGHVRGDDADDFNGHGATATNIPVITGFNPLSRIVPVEITIAESGIALTPGTPTTGDRLWNPKGDGTYDLIYNNNVNQPFPQLTPGLRFDGGGNVDASGEPLQSGYLIERRAGPGVVTVSVPDSLDL